MVFFTCNHCGESAKKPAVDKHYKTKCRGAPVNVSCMDCQKDFHGDEYVAHTSCISEAQKYSGKDFVPKEAKNSGKKKQDSWMEIVRSILDSKEYSLSNSVRGAFQKLQNYDNVPRKKAKFENFIKNCLRMRPAEATEVWNILEKEQTKMKAANAKPPVVSSGIENGKGAVENDNSAEAQNGDDLKQENVDSSEQNGEAKKKSKSKKRPLEESNDDVQIIEIDESAPKKKKKKSKSEAEVPEPEETQNANEEVSNETGKFEWSDVIIKIVGKQNEIALEKLKKKVLKKYFSQTQTEITSEKQERKLNKTFTKHLKKCNLQVDNDIVKFSS